MLQPRGRSRQVSNTALARQASEERRSSSSPSLSQQHHHSLPILAPVPMKAPYTPTFIHSTSPSPPSSASMSPDYYDLPPSPPRSLEDQVHVAYALDDIHLAKILLLRLKGIEITSDDDPRIAAVQDEDFDFCFVPNGRLMDDTDEKTIKQMQTRELKRLEERRRFDRLKHCEKIWDDQKRRMREERLAVFRQRERMWLEEEDRRNMTEQRRKLEEERRRAQKTIAAVESQRAALRTRAQLVCYDNLPSSSEKRISQQFVYDFMVLNAPSSPKPASSRSPPIPHSRPRLRGPIFDDSRSVPFMAVLDSMQGPLFPLSNEDLLQNHSPSINRSASRTHSQAIRRRERQLLDALLVDIECTEDQRRNRKGKQKAQPRESPLPCPACSIASSPTSPISPAPSTTSTSSSGSISRTSSWLSFVGSSPPTSSSSIDLVTPPTSPASSLSCSKSHWFKSTTVSSLAARPKSWVATSNLFNPRFPPPPHSCTPHSRFSPVTSSESPLSLNPPHPIKSTSSPMSYNGRQRSTSTVRAAKEGAGLLVRRMSRFVEIAKGFHQSYVNIALSTETESWETGSNERYKFGDVPDPNSSMNMGRGSRLRAPGYRVNQRDVAVFLSSSEAGSSFSSLSDESSGSGSDTAAASNDLILLGTSLPPPPKYIPLRSTFDLPRTVLPDPLPYRLLFKPIPMPIRSPFRFHALSEMHTMYPTGPSPFLKSPSSCDLQSLFSRQGPLTWRIRSVGNPVYLRLKALHNVIWKGGMVWEGRGRDTALGGGRERIVGVAYDGVGRSSLSWEVKREGMRTFS